MTSELDAEQTKPQTKRVACMSWIPALATTRSLMLTEAGYEVISLCGKTDLERLGEYVNCLDLLILAHSVPVAEKRRALVLFKQGNRTPVLSLLNFHQTKLPEADFGVEAFSPSEFVRVVKEILE